MDEKAPPSAGFYDFIGWVDVNKHRIGIAVLVLLLVGTVVGFIVWRQGERKIEGERALSAVPMPFSPSELPEPGTGDKLAQIAEEYSGTPAGEKALLRSGTVYFALGDFAKSQAQFERFLRDYTESRWVPQAVFGIAATLDAQGKNAEAIAKYNDFIKNYPNDPALEQARLDLARLYERSNQPALALETLQKLTGGQQPGASMAAMEAQDRIRQLYAKNPSLIPSNPVTPTMLQNFTNLIRQTNIVVPTNAALPVVSPTPAAPQTQAPQAPAPTPAPQAPAAPAPAAPPAK